MNNLEGYSFPGTMNDKVQQENVYINRNILSFQL